MRLGTKIALLDGVTTWLSTEYGALDIDRFYNEREKRHSNYGASVCHLCARMKVLDGVEVQDDVSWLTATHKVAEKGKPNWSVTITNEEQRKEIFKILRKGLDRGALGIGFAIGYASAGITAKAKDVYEAQKLAGSYGRYTAVHPRFGSYLPPAEFILGGHEILANAMVLNASTIFSHFNNASWYMAAEMLEKARAHGYNVGGGIYPYESYSTSTLIGSEFVTVENLKANGLKPEDVVLDPSTGKFLPEEEFERLRKEKPSHIVVIFSRKKEWIPKWVALEEAVIASDGMVAMDSDVNIFPENAPLEKVATPPRLAGTQVKALCTAREHNIPLMRVLANLSYWVAKHLGDTGLEAMKLRGRMQEGKVADITIFYILS